MSATSAAAGCSGLWSSWPIGASKQVFDPALKVNERVKAEAFARGLAGYPMGGTIDGKRGDHYIIAPPYIVTASEIDTIVDRLGEAVDAALQGIGDNLCTKVLTGCGSDPSALRLSAALV